MKPNQYRRRLSYLILGLLVVVLMGCGGREIQSETEPRATDRPKPTETAAPPTPTPEPIVLTGSGNDVVDFEKFEGAAIARITHNGEGNFSIVTYDEAGEYLALLVNHIGDYQGVRPIDFKNDERATRFQVESEGDWTIEIVPVAGAEVLRVPGEFEGSGDNVYVIGGDADTVQATATEGNFALWGYGDRVHLITNEIAPYEGESLLPSDLAVLVVESDGAWTLEFRE